MHLALASVAGPAFEPESFNTRSLRVFVSQAIAHAGSVLDLLEQTRDALPEGARAGAAVVLDQRAALLEQFRDVELLADAGQRIRVHGDYHLGQVLRTEEDFVILDFEGEPARTLEERRAKHSPLKDVAGMLRSFHYASAAALMAFGQSSAAGAERLAHWREAWQHWVSGTFLAAYREAMGASRVLPGPGSFDSMLQALILDKALYELRYELNSRPEWAHIPLGALVALASPLQR